MIIVDVETTGTDPQKHSIVSIGAVDFSNPQNQFYQECRIWDGAGIVPESLKINGFTEEEIKDRNKMSLEEAIKKFLDWAEKVEERTIAGQNPFFDNGFLKASAERYGLQWTFGFRVVDLHSLFYVHYLCRGAEPPIEDGRSNLSLDDILVYVGLPSEPEPHNALTGARVEAEALSRFIYKKPLLKEFEEFALPDYLH